ncbi:MAG: hypothetical protein KDI15_07200 [Thiothrix sp.]|nr:hypothetical protein [Thiothrix sp.]HPE60198.1 capsular polysaccharide synthesis protein [Thiolinea sp.]
MNMNLPRIIWIYWDQGSTRLPFVVGHCVASWRARHPDWEVRLLERSQLSQWITVQDIEPRPDMPVQLFTDLVRLRLLRAHGGVWADATLFCVQPLPAWLPPRLQQGFFAFASQRPDRLMTNWFLAATPQSPLLQGWSRDMETFFAQRHFPPQTGWRRQLIRRLTSLRKRGLLPNRIWFHPLVSDTLKLRPYPLPMYQFGDTLERHPALANQWRERDVLYDTGAEWLQNRLGMNQALTPEGRAFIDSDATPVHKLNWRQDPGRLEPATHLGYLLTTRDAGQPGD